MDSLAEPRLNRLPSPPGHFLPHWLQLFTLFRFSTAAVSLLPFQPHFRLLWLLFHVSITTMFVNRLFVAMDTARPAEPRAVWASQKLELSYSFEPLSEGALSGGIDFK